MGGSRGWGLGLDPLGKSQFICFPRNTGTDPLEKQLEPSGPIASRGRSVQGPVASRVRSLRPSVEYDYKKKSAPLVYHL